MSWQTINDGVMVGFLASVPLGPIGIVCIQRTLQRGRLSGFVSGLGAVFTDTLYAIIAGFSLSYIITFIEERIIWLQLFGAIILVLLGIHIFRSNPATQLRRNRLRRNSLWKDFLSTAFLTLSNPLAIFLFIAFFAGFRVLDRTMGAIDHFILIGSIFVGAALWWLILTSIVALFRPRINMRSLFWINKIAGSAIITLVVIGLLVFLGKAVFL